MHQRGDAGLSRCPSRFHRHAVHARPCGERLLVKVELELGEARDGHGQLGDKGLKRRRLARRKAREIQTLAIDRQIAVRLWNGRERSCTQHRADARSVRLAHLVDTDRELDLGVAAVLRDRSEKLVLGAAGASTFSQDSATVFVVCRSTVGQQANVFRKLLERVEPASAGLVALCR